jgi:hypothetical protein
MTTRKAVVGRSGGGARRTAQDLTTEALTTTEVATSEAAVAGRSGGRGSGSAE